MPSTKKKKKSPTSLNTGRLMVQRENAISLLDQGKTAAQVARRLGIPEHTVRAYKAWSTMGAY